jgi:hypothetical protein
LKREAVKRNPATLLLLITITRAKKVQVALGPSKFGGGTFKFGKIMNRAICHYSGLSSSRQKTLQIFTHPHTQLGNIVMAILF